MSKPSGKNLEPFQILGDHVVQSINWSRGHLEQVGIYRHDLAESSDFDYSEGSERKGTSEGFN